MAALSDRLRRLFCFLVTLGLCYCQEAVHPTGSCDQNSSDITDFTLNQALLQLNSSDAFLYLLPGVHCVRDYTFVASLSNITLKGQGRDSVAVECSDGVGLTFFDIWGLSISDLTISGCGAMNFTEFQTEMNKIVESIFQISRYYRIALLCGNCTDFSMNSTAITETNGLGFLGINVVGESSFNNVEFSLNTPEECFHVTKNISYSDPVGGGAMFLYVDYLNSSFQSEERSSITFQDCVFLNNSYCGLEIVYEIYYKLSEVAANRGFFLGGGGGLTLAFTQVGYGMSATMDSCVFQNNTSLFGGGSLVKHFEGVSNIEVLYTMCIFENNGLEGDQVINNGISGAGLGVLLDLSNPNILSKLHFPIDTSVLVNVSGTNFTDNKGLVGGGALVKTAYTPLADLFETNVIFCSCYFERNFAAIGAAIHLQESTTHTFALSGKYFRLEDVHILGSIVYIADQTIVPFSEASAAVEAFSVNLTISDKSEISHTQGTGIHSTGSLITIKGDVTFVGNSGLYGGAVRLESASILLIANHSNVWFINNSAAIQGGAIYSKYATVLTSYQPVDCFLYFGDQVDVLCIADIAFNCSDIAKVNSTIKFSGNTAPMGSIWFGSTLETCPWASPFRQQYAPNVNTTLLEIFYEQDSLNITTPFHFDVAPDSAKVVTTETNMIVIDTSVQSAVPGKLFYVKVAALDRFNRTVPTLLTTNARTLMPTDYIDSSLGFSRYWFNQELNFSVVPMRIFGPNGTGNVTVLLYSLDSLTQSRLTVNLLNCSHGFYPHDGRCVCNYIFKYSRVDCNESSQNFTVPNDLWIGPSPDDSLMIYDCQIDYCKPGAREVAPPDYDVQCRDGYNRGGVLCGGCKDGFSIIFGGNKCLKCGNAYLTLLVYFAIAGVAVIASIVILQVTIAEGYLNGMLFYANIVSLYVPFFLFEHSTQRNLFLLVSYLNLDLGIEVCFFDGMNTLARTGLDLVFPAYLYVLMFIIVILANRSQRFSARFTRNKFSAAKLFATLILMTYTSILQTCSEILGVARVTNFQDEHFYLWRADPNQLYFHGWHALLVVISIVLVFLFIIPVPFILILPAVALKIRFVTRFKPVYDAFWAPFKTRYRFWVGLRLLLRGFPFVFAYFAFHPLNLLLLGIFLVVLLLVQLLLMPFDGFARNAFDAFFLSNILGMTLGALYFAIERNYDNNGQYKYSNTHVEFIFFAVAVLLAYVAFVAIVLWHIILRFPSLKTLPKGLKNRFGSQKRRHEETLSTTTTSTTTYGTAPIDKSVNNDGPAGEESDDTLPTPVSYSELREPLLDMGSTELLKLAV